MRGHLSRNQEKAILALLTEPTLAKAADKVGITANTLWRWMQLDEFNESYLRAKRDAFSQAIGRLQQAATQAVDTLQDVMGNKKAAAMARVRAAEIVLEMAHKGIETEDIAARMDEMEEILKGDAV